MHWQGESEIVKQIVDEFALQIIHEPIKITANGFFVVDLDHLGSVRVNRCFVQRIVYYYYREENSHGTCSKCITNQPYAYF